jgi:hypothetical protein
MSQRKEDAQLTSHQDTLQGDLTLDRSPFQTKVGQKGLIPHWLFPRKVL